jgi:branched-chain amino acid transport system ATP-binding protein
VTAARLTAADLGMSFQGLHALSQVDFAVPPGEIRGLIGPNGAGKTTMFNCLTGFYQPTAGQVSLDDTRIDGLPPHRISQLGVSRTFQNIRLFANMTAIENVLVAGQSHDEGPPPLRPDWMHERTDQRVRRLAKEAAAGAGKALAEMAAAVARPRRAVAAERESIAAARMLLSVVGLSGRENQLARNLPYGDQRRLEIARALGTRPRLLLLDEPTAGMNPQESLAVVDLIRRVRDDFDTTVILIEHQMRVVMGVCERITVLDYGRKLAEGTPAEIQRDERVVAAYLGRGSGEEGEHGAA